MSKIDHPRHYRKDTGHEAIDVIESWNLNFNLGNVVKYVSRSGIKDPDKHIEDLEKARWYLSREIDLLKTSIERFEKQTNTRHANDHK